MVIASCCQFLFPRSSEFEEEEGDLVIDESMVGDLVKNIQTIDMMSSQI